MSRTYPDLETGENVRCRVPNGLEPLAGIPIIAAGLRAALTLPRHVNRRRPGAVELSFIAEPALVRNLALMAVVTGPFSITLEDC